MRRVLGCGGSRNKQFKSKHHSIIMQALRSGGRERHHLIHVPTDIADRPDLVIALHALGSNPRLMEVMTLLSSRADERGFIVCYPEGIRSAVSGITSWNARFCCRDAKAEGTDDVLFISDLIDAFMDERDIGRVLITGFSNGGMLAHVAGIELSGKIDMIAPVAATVGKEILDFVPKRPVEALIIHGQDDRLVPYASRGDDRFLPAVEAECYWARANGCSAVGEETTSDAIVRRYGGGACRVTSIVVKNAGHVWPGGRARMGGEHDPKTVDATSLILERFLSND